MQLYTDSARLETDVDIFLFFSFVYIAERAINTHFHVFKSHNNPKAYYHIKLPKL